MSVQAVTIKREAPPPIAIEPLRWELESATAPAEIKIVAAKLDAFESYMHDSDLYSIEDMRPINELRMTARWKLGRALRVVERASHPGKGKLALSSLTSLLQSIGLTKPTALEAQRIGTLPELELHKAFAWARQESRLLHYGDLITWARPWWYKASREDKHQGIHLAAAGKTLEHRGPFPLIYADPPWKFEIYSEKGLERTPDQHYPTLSLADIKAFTIDDAPICKIAHRDAALLLWCTSSNLHLGLEVLTAWGFTFKASAVWVKDKSGLGLVFRNQHEVLLYGTRGNMPGPQYQPPSVFQYPRGAHSAKPPEVRGIIEQMYPDFDARTRLELFARDKIDGWSSYGFES